MDHALPHVMVEVHTCTFEEEDGKFVQILNIHDTHWICVTNVGLKPNEVKVYK